MNLAKSTLIGIIVIILAILVLIIFNSVTFLNVKTIRDEINRVPDFLSISLKNKDYLKTNSDINQTFQIEVDLEKLKSKEINNIKIDQDKSIVLNKDKIYRISFDPSVENSDSFAYNALFEVRNRKAEILAAGFHYWGQNNDSFYRDTSKINFIFSTKNLSLSERTIGFYMIINDASDENVKYTVDSKFSNISINEIK
ncbi:MAG: hypothetical protein GY932_06870 [Arcobacter sp.]|nr:hypothetical protein [Flavobacteriaceae bacterium]MCP4970295.1 hypothetical protein [Arcobacter sp.]